MPAVCEALSGYQSEYKRALFCSKTQIFLSRFSHEVVFSLSVDRADRASINHTGGKSGSRHSLLASSSGTGIAMLAAGFPHFQEETRSLVWKV